MDFYRQWVRYFDVVFPVQKQRLDFLRKVLAEYGARKVLDVGCGTGSYVLEMATWGLSVTGLDLDSEMIAVARARASRLLSEQEGKQPNAAKKRITFLVGDMRSLAELGVDFDAVICTGNTLAHLLEEADITGALKEMSSRLRKGGVLILQVVNFDAVPPDRRWSLPTIRIDEIDLTFLRTYDPTPNRKIDFTARFEFGPRAIGTQPGSAIEASTLLRPIYKAELARWLPRAGLLIKQIYGGFDGSPHEGNAPATIVVAEKT